MRRISEIIVHCTATPEGRQVTVAEIDGWHKARGFKEIGYHYVVGPEGEIMKGRDDETVGAHCLGHNSHSIGVCYVGGLSADGKKARDTRTGAQKIALRELLSSLKKRYPAAIIYGHNNFAAKACPCFDAITEYRDL